MSPCEVVQERADVRIGIDYIEHLPVFLWCGRGSLTTGDFHETRESGITEGHCKYSHTSVNWLAVVQKGVVRRGLTIGDVGCLQSGMGWTLLASVPLVLSGPGSLGRSFNADSLTFQVG